MVSFPRYERYKDSRVEWLGEIPEHWETLRTKNIFRLRTKVAPKNNNEELLSIYSDIGVKPRKELEERGNKASTTDGYWIVEKGDFIVNKLLAWMGAIGVSEYDGVTSPAYDILRAYKPINNKFYHYLFRNKICLDKLKQHSKGIMEMRLRLYFDEFGKIQLPYPPVEEQNKIAKFLDRKTEEIDRAIAHKKRLIELLEEQKTILINQTVTKGLNPNAPMKDSGIDLLGKIPNHWELIKLGYTGYLQNGISEGSEYFGSGYPFVNYTDVYNNPELPKQVIGLAKSSKEDRVKYSVKKGDVFFTRTSEIIEEIGIASTCLTALENAIFSGFLIRFRPLKGLLIPNFQKYYFRAQFQRFFFTKEVNLVTRASLSQQLLKRLPVLLPPQTEQKEIAYFLDCECNKIDQAKLKTEKQIEILTELKQILIAEAVTGKIKI